MMQNNTQQLTNMNNRTFFIFVDGASRGNPGPAGAGIHIKFDNKDIIKKGIYLGEKTNNQAEYLALALGILYVQQYCKKHNILNNDYAITSDSELLIKQMLGIYKVKNEGLKPIKSFIDAQLLGYKAQFTHVLREKNKIADMLANTGIDKKHPIPADFLQTLSLFGLFI